MTTRDDHMIETLREGNRELRAALAEQQQAEAALQERVEALTALVGELVTAAKRASAALAVTNLVGANIAISAALARAREVMGGEG